MPIWYVNPTRKKSSRTRLVGGGFGVPRKRVVRKQLRRSKARRTLPKSTKKMPPGLRRYWLAQKRKARPRRRKNPHMTALANPRRRRKRRRNAALLYTNPRRKARRARRTPMAKRKRKSSKRRRAALKAWRTRRKKYGPKGRKRGGGRRRKARRTYSKRSRAARKAWRTRRKKYGRGGRHFSAGAMVNPRKRRRRRRKNARRMNPRRRRRRRNAFAPVLANPRRRRRRRRNRRHNPRRRRRGALASFRRRNPLGGLMAVAKQALPVVAAMVGGRLIVKQLMKIGPLSSLGQHANPLLHAAMVFGANFATNKVRFLAKYKSGIMVGLGVNLIESLIKTYAPASVQAALGAGEGIYEQMGAFREEMGEYMETGEYIETGAEEELGEYVETGAYEELGAGGPPAGVPMLAPVPSARMLAPVPARSMVRTVPQWSPAADKLDSLYTGVFGGWGWGY